MSHVDGLRAWIGELERKLGVRTRVVLVLVAIAIAGAGAGVYLALNATNSGASEAEVQEVEERLQGEIDQLSTEAASGVDPQIARLELQVKALQAEVKALQPGGAKK